MKPISGLEPSTLENQPVVGTFDGIWDHTTIGRITSSEGKVVLGFCG